MVEASYPVVPHALVHVPIDKQIPAREIRMKNKYQYRPRIAGYWGDWYPNSLYFLTPSLNNANKNINSGQTIVGHTIPADKKKFSRLTVFPNPARSQVTIVGEYPLLSKYTIRDANGATVKAGIVTGSSIDLSDVQSGVLMLTLEEGTFRKTVSLIKL